MTSLRYTVSVALSLAINSALPSLLIARDFNPPAKSSIPDDGHPEQQVGSSAKISSDTVRGYISWIVQQTGWTAADIPPIKITSLAHMRDMLLGPSSGMPWIRPAALYSKSEHLINLSESWKKDDLLDQSILVHELVHHLQVQNRIQLECWGRYEAQAYDLQINWLSAQGVRDPYSLLHASRTAIKSLAECP